MGIVDAARRGESTTTGKIRGALASLPAAGGIVDCRGFVGPQDITGDLFRDLPTRRTTLLFGPETYTVGPADATSAAAADWRAAIQHPSSGTRLVLEGTTFRALQARDAGGAPLGHTRLSAMFEPRWTLTGGSVARGSAVVSAVHDPAEADPGDLLLVFGHRPRNGRDDTVLAVDLAAGDTVIPVRSAAGFPIPGYLAIGDELVYYTGVDAPGDRFTGCRRGYGGTTAVAHPAGGDVDRCVYEKYRIVERTGATLVLDRPVDATFVARATSTNLVIGSTDLHFEGCGAFEGGRGREHTGYNGICVLGRAVRRLTTSAQLEFSGWELGAVAVGPAEECTIRGAFHDIGWPAKQLGGAVWLIRNAARCTVEGEYARCNCAVIVDDRSDEGQVDDNPSDANVVRPGPIASTRTGIVVSGSSLNSVVAPLIAGWSAATGGAAIDANGPQWRREPRCARNYIELLATDDGGAPGASAIRVTPQYAGSGNVVVCRQPGAVVSAPPGVSVVGP